jgi:hypothetical protein
MINLVKLAFIFLFLSFSVVSHGKIKQHSQEAKAFFKKGYI